MRDYARMYDRRAGGRHYADSKRRADLTLAVVLALFTGGWIGYLLASI